jgi:hypothetical protein
MRLAGNKPWWPRLVGQTLALLGCMVSLLSAAEWRTWNSKVGTEVEAQYLSQTETHVALKTKAGVTLNVEKSKLSDNDQEFLKWLVEDAKKLAKPQPAAPAGTTPAGTTPAKKSAPPATQESPGKGELAKGANSKTADPKATDPEPAGKRKLQQPETDKLEQPLNAYPLSSDWLNQRPLPDPPNTDYAKLASELCAPVPRAKFVQVRKFKLPLVNPNTAQIAQAGHYLVDHNDKQEALDVWNLDTGKLVKSINVGPLANPRCFAISPAGSLVGMGRSDQALVAFHAATGKTMCIVPRLATEGKKLLRLAFNWEEDEIVTLNDSGEFQRMLLLGPQFKRYAFDQAIPENFADWATHNDEIWLTVSGQGRIGARITDRYTYSCYIQTQEAGFKAHAHRTHLAIPVRAGLVYWSRNELTRYGVSYSSKLTAAKQVRNPAAQYRAFDCLDFAQYSLDRRDQYLWVSNFGGTETIDIYDLDCFDIPVRVAAPMKDPGNHLHWHSSSTRRLHYFDRTDQLLTSYELQQFEPPPSWKIITAFHRAFLEKRYDRLEGLAVALDNEPQQLVGGRQLPVLTDVIRTFNRQQFLVPPDEWQHRLATWLRERPDSTLVRLILAQNRIGAALRATENDPPLKNELPANAQARQWIKEAEGFLREPLAAKQPWGETLYLQLRLAPLLGWEKDKCLELAARMAKIAPRHTDFHYQMCKLLLPEERGDVGDTELYAKTIADHFPQEAGNILYSYMVYRTVRGFGLEDYKQRLKFDWRRARDGFVADYKQHPDDPAAIQRARDWRMYNTANPENLSKEDKPDFEPIFAAYKKMVETHGWNVYLRIREGRVLLED